MTRDPAELERQREALANLTDYQCRNVLAYMIGRWPDQFTELMVEATERDVLPKSRTSGRGPGSAQLDDLDRLHMLAGTLMGLDRCEHGQHAMNVCGDCPGGHSVGNLILRPGTVIGHGMNGVKIIVPMPDDRHDPLAWRVRE